jgi:hypothetical protein
MEIKIVFIPHARASFFLAPCVPHLFLWHRLSFDPCVPHLFLWHTIVCGPRKYPSGNKKWKRIKYIDDFLETQEFSLQENE